MTIESVRHRAHFMCLKDDAQIAGGRELWGFSKTLGLGSAVFDYLGAKS